MGRGGRDGRGDGLLPRSGRLCPVDVGCGWARGDPIRCHPSFHTHEGRPARNATPGVTRHTRRTLKRIDCLKQRGTHLTRSKTHTHTHVPEYHTTLSCLFSSWNLNCVWSFFFGVHIANGGAFFMPLFPNVVCFFFVLGKVRWWCHISCDSRCKKVVLLLTVFT